MTALNGENHEHTDLYPGFAPTAREEYLDQIARVWDAVCLAEKQLKKRHRDLTANRENNPVYQKSKSVLGRCLGWCYLLEGTQAPNICPACDHSQAHFDLLGENW